MPTADEQADLVAAGLDGARTSATVADTAENLAASFAGWLGGDLASAPLRDALPGFTIAPQTCRTDILAPGLEPGFLEVRLQQVLPESFVLDEGPPYRARALQWGGRRIFWCSRARGCGGCDRRMRRSGSSRRARRSFSACPRACSPATRRR